MTKRLILALLLSCSPLWATTYYVDNCVTVGSDRNKGTSTSTPWLTINKVNTSKFNPGDSILFESTCTWREQLTVPSSGSAGSPITFGAYGTGAQPIISGANLFTSWTLSSGSVYYTSYSTAPNQVFEDGSRLTQNTTSSASLTAGQWYLDTVNKWIWVYLTAGDDPSGHVMEASQRTYAIYGNSVSYVTVSAIEATEANTHGIEFSLGTGILVTGISTVYNYGIGLQTVITNVITITQSTAAYNGGSGIYLYAPGTSLVDHVVAHDNAQLTPQSYAAGINAGGVGNSGATTIQYCVTYNNGLAISGVNSSGAGIWLDTANNYSVVQYNLAYNNYHGGIDIDADNYATVIYNLSYGNHSAGAMATGIHIFADAQTTMTGHQVYGNTVYGNDHMGMDVNGYTGGTSNGCTNNLIENNIVVGTTSGRNLSVTNGCQNTGGYGSGNVYTYNDFGNATSNFIQWGTGNYYSSYSSWETAAGSCGTSGCSHSVQAAPAFANAAASQFWLASGSPAIDAGLNLGSPYNIGLMPGSTWPDSVVTGGQNAYGSGWEIGAFVYVPPVPPPSNLQVVKVN